MSKKYIFRNDLASSIVLVSLIVCAVIFTAVMYDKHTALLYEDDLVSISRSNGSISVLAAQTGEEYRYTLRRVKRDSMAAQTLIESNTFTIQLVGNMLVLMESDYMEYIRL